MKINYIAVTQPIGTFYITSIEASVLAKIVTVERRTENAHAVQREESDKRIKEIAKYCGDTDATFPTPIIIAVSNKADISIDPDFIEFDEKKIIGEVIDGQHRLGGLKKSQNISDFQLPVVLMFNLMSEEKAYVFSIINSKQTRVNMSLIYDLFSLSENRSPYKTCHEIARALNRGEDSPLYNRLKMLGKKEKGQELASLSQGTFIKYMLELISRNPGEDTRRLKKGEDLECDETFVLRSYFIEGKDSIILKIITNLFGGVSKALSEEWLHPHKYILSKSIGFGAIIKAFPEIYKKGVSEHDLSTSFFEKIFEKFKEYLQGKNISLTSEKFGSNEQARTQLSKYIIESIILPKD